jgi:hypothetical protein
MEAPSASAPEGDRPGLVVPICDSDGRIMLHMRVDWKCVCFLWWFG